MVTAVPLIVLSSHQWRVRLVLTLSGFGCLSFHPMLESLCCRACLAPLQPEDGHDLCPSCLGIDHLRQGLSEEACPNCFVLPRDVRVARLTALDSLSTQSDDLPAAQPETLKRPAACAAKSAPLKRAKKSGPTSKLSSQVDFLTSELAHVRALLQNIQPRAVDSDARFHSEQDVASLCEEDAMSVAASDTLFRMDAVDLESHGSEVASQASTDFHGSDDGSAPSVVRAALAHLQLDAPQTAEASDSVFFKRQRAVPAFAVPPSTDYVKQLHACWTDTKALSRLTSDGRALASMRDAPQFGLGHMPPVEPAIASLIVSPDEALRANPRCPNSQCRITDELLCRSYDTGARMGRLGNSLSHLLLGLSTALETAQVEGPTLGLLDASLQTFALMSRELGRLLSTLSVARRQVWLAQSPLTESCRRTLRNLPVVPGELFGAAAADALERTAQASRTRQQLIGLHRRPAPPRGASVSHRGAPRGPGASSSICAPLSRRAAFAQDLRRADRIPAQGPSRAAHADQRLSRPSKGQKSRR